MGGCQSVPREPRSGPARWAWWLEVNPVDGEVCAPPWANLRLVDLAAVAKKREWASGTLHRCTPCAATWKDFPGAPVSPCWSCGEPPDDDWTSATRVRSSTSDGGLRSLDVPGSPGGL